MIKMAVLIFDTQHNRKKEYSVVGSNTPGIIGDKEEMPGVSNIYTLISEENAHFKMIVTDNDIYQLYETDKYGDDEVLREVGDYYDLTWEGTLNEATWL